MLQKDEEGAKSLFTALTKPAPDGMTAPDPFIVAWSHIYLGRIDDTDSERDRVNGDSTAASADVNSRLASPRALLVDGAPDAAKAAAQNGVEKGRAAAKQPGDHLADEPG